MMAWGNSFDWPTAKTVELVQNKIDRTWPDPIIPNIHNFEIVETLKKEQHKLSNADIEAHSTDLMYDGVAFTKVSVENGDLKISHIPNVKVFSNLKPTHDPYTNPNAHIYYECGCGAILDPGTKRFAELNNCASNAGWKIRFGDSGYVPYCVECGKGVPE